jgi:regulator of protease activity HflC (stomatin/prohibitin superfamily)
MPTSSIIGYLLVFFAVIVVFSSFVTVKQGTIAVITIFGKYRRILTPGLNFKIPLIESIYSKISIQNRSVELEFQAVTFDQANVYFKAMLLYSVLDQSEEAIKNVAFKFVDERNLMQALIRTVEGSIRAFVATKAPKRSADIAPRYCGARKRATGYRIGGLGLSSAGSAAE